jgi:hypothetical protein
MSDSIAVLLEKARDLRKRERSARGLAAKLLTQDVIDNLIVYAAELKEQAAQLEQQAISLADAYDDDNPLSPELRALIEVAKERRRAMP